MLVEMAERGERVMDNTHGRNQYTGPVQGETDLASLGILRTQSHRWQLLARLTDEELDRAAPFHACTAVDARSVTPDLPRLTGSSYPSRRQARRPGGDLSRRSRRSEGRPMATVRDPRCLCVDGRSPICPAFHVPEPRPAPPREPEWVRRMREGRRAYARPRLIDEPL